MSRVEAYSQPRGGSIGSSGSARTALVVGTAMALALALVLAAWVGFIASDDTMYAYAADQWLSSAPFLPSDHWSVRHPVVLPIALSFALFGHDEFTVALPTLAYWLALVGITAWQLSRRVSGGVLAASLAVLVTAPVLVVWSSIASADVAETFFIACSLWAFVSAPGQADSDRRMLLAGVLAGLAYLSRDTAVALVVFYAGCFVLGAFRTRRELFWVGVGAAGVVLIECVWYLVATGDPLRRFNIALHHDSTVDRKVELAGNILVGRAFDPLMMLVANQEFALIFVVGLPVVAWWTVRTLRRGGWRRPEPAAVLSVYTVAWVGFFYAAASLLPLNPRYAMNICYTTLVVLALTAQAARPRVGLKVLQAAAAVLVLANVASLALESRDLTFGERVLVDQLVASPQTVIHTSGKTLRRATPRLEWAGVKDRAVSTAPAPGALYLWNPYRPDDWPAGVRLSGAPPRPDGWEAVRSFDPPGRRVETLLTAVGADRVLPGFLRSRILKPRPPVVLYRAG